MHHPISSSYVNVLHTLYPSYVICPIISVSFLLASELLPQLHQQHSQSVLSRAVSPVAPVAVLVSVLHYLSVAGGEQQFQQFGMLRELQPQSIFHDLLLDLLPVAPQRNRPFVSSAECFCGGGSLNDVLLFGSALELFGLEVVFVGGVDELSIFELGEGLVAETSVGGVDLVEVDRALVVLHQIVSKYYARISNSMSISNVTV